jgi:hypothetical protein
MGRTDDGRHRIAIIERGKIIVTDTESQEHPEQSFLGLQPVCAVRNHLNVCVDPRLELLSAVQWLSEYRTKFPLLTRLDFPYQRALVDHVAGLEDHEVVSRLNARISGTFSYENPPFAFSAPPETMLYLNSAGRLHESICANAFLVRRAGGRESLEAFVAALADFCEASRFAGFFEEHRATYERVVGNTLEKLGSRDYIRELEHLYGIHHAGYTLILVPLYHSVGFGPNVTIGGAKYVYNIMGPREVEDGLPDFGSEAYFTEMQRHEFSHSFVNPLTERFWAVAEPYFAAYDSPVEAQEYANESIVRAVTTWLAYGDGQAAGDAALARELERGFVLVKPLVAKIRGYAAQRDAYASFEEFYPHLLGAFEDHARRRYTDDSTAELVEPKA